VPEKKNPRFSPLRLQKLSCGPFRLLLQFDCGRGSPRRPIEQRSLAVALCFRAFTHSSMTRVRLCIRVARVSPNRSKAP